MLAYDPATNPLNTNEWAYPLTECVHVASMSLSVGCIALVDLRMLGFGFRSTTAADLVRETEWWTVLGLFLAISSGLLIFSTDPAHIILNGSFQFKMAVLTIGLIFNYTIHRKVAFSGSSTAPLVACASLALWIAPIAAAIFMAFL